LKRKYELKKRRTKREVRRMAVLKQIYLPYYSSGAVGLYTKKENENE